VPFENPSWTVPMAQQNMGLCQGIGTATFPPKAIGMAVGLRFRDRIEPQQVECLHGPVDHGGNPESAQFAVAFGNVHPAERLRLVTVPTQSGESGRLGFRCVPEDSVHPGSLRTRITDNSQNGQSPATERVREQINQSLDFIPSALRNGLQPGKEAALPPPPPLRTAHESFPSCSSSLHKRPSRDAVAFVRRSRTWI